MTRFICTYAALVLLSACASHTPIATCPAVVPYSEAAQNQAADELCEQVGLAAGCTAEEMATKPQTMLGKMMDDYGVTRAQLRACRQ